MKVTFLGTGTSRGIPVVGCSCAVCCSDDPRDKRLRCSLLIEEGETRVVIDTSSDFRQQMLRAWVPEITAVVLTHFHADHILGLDDLFPFGARSERPIPVFGDRKTLEGVRGMFPYLFDGTRYARAAKLEPKEIRGPFSIGGIGFQPVELFHGKMPVLGFRIGDFAYLTDVSEIPEAGFLKLKGLTAVALDALRHRPHPTHFSLAQAVEAAGRIGAEKCWLVHMSHEVSHSETSPRLPHGIDLAVDGMTLEF